MPKIFTIALLLLNFTCFNIAIAQTDQQKASSLARQATKEMDNGNIDQALKLLKDAQTLDTANIIYRYQTASAHFLNKDFKKSIRILEPLTKHRDVSPHIYRLLGNSYDNVGKQEKALEAYQEGLKLSPNDGKLYLELGVIYSMKKKQDKALEFFEKGIEMDPKFPSNYYWAAKIYAHSAEEMWGLIYGELFINMERTSQRSYEISKLLFDTYKHIAISTDSTHKISENVSSFKNAYENTLLKSSQVAKGEFKLASLIKIRQNFLSQWKEKQYDTKYANILIDWQKQVEENRHSEAYNYWLFHQGNVAEFEEWSSKNEEQLRDFITWFAKTSFEVNSKHSFVKKQY